MDGHRIEQALARIEAASRRIEAAAARPAAPSADPGIEQRYRQLRSEAGAALIDLDKLIGSLEA